MKTTTRKTLQYYWEHIKVRKLAFFTIIMTNSIAFCLSVYRPLWYKKLFDGLALNQFDLEPQLVQIIVVLLILNLIEFIFWRIAGFTNNYFQPRVISDLHVTCFRYLQDHSYNFFSNNFTGSLVKRVGRFSRSFEEITDQLFWGMGQR